MSTSTATPSNNTSNNNGTNNTASTSSTTRNNGSLREMLLSFRDRSTTKRRKISTVLTKEQCLEHLAETWTAHTTCVTAPPLTVLGTDRTLKREAAIIQHRNHNTMMTEEKEEEATSSSVSAPTDKVSSNEKEEMAKDDDADASVVKDETKEETKQDSASAATTTTNNKDAETNDATKVPGEADTSAAASTKKKRKNVNTIVSVQSLINENAARYKEMLQQEQEELDAIEAKRQTLLREQVELWGVYKYGLKKIAGLPDLGVAPDAILPGNF